MTAVPVLIRSSHPLPALAVTCITLIFGLSIGLETWRLAVLVAAALLNQLSVGLSNDWLDLRRDLAVQRTDKPLVRNQAQVLIVRNAAFITLGLCLVIPLFLGWACAVAHLGAVASGWAYNLKLKGTVVSWLPYALSFGLLPVVVSLAQGNLALPPVSTFVAGALLGVSAHFANVLPDLEDDRLNGLLGLPHRLERARSAVVLVAAMCAGSIVTALSIVDDSPLIGWASFAAALVLAAATSVLLATRPRSKWLFRLTLLSGVVNVATLALSFGQSRLLAI